MNRGIKQINKIENALIIKRRKRLLRRKIFILSLLLIMIVSVLCLKLSYFNITAIEVVNNKNISSGKIIEMSHLQKGNNIFYSALLGSKNAILKNPYILDVKIHRKLPNTIVINVAEREAMYYNSIDSNYMVIDSNGILLEKRNNIDGMKLIKLDGFDLKKSVIGKQIVSNDDDRIQILNKLSEMTAAKKFLSGISEIDLTDPIAIKMYYGGIELRLGDIDNFENKLNTAANILERDELKQAKKGYIDVSFKGNPVFHIEEN